ncbi:MAG: glycosyltransferase [Bacteroidales bacterium]|nr:glycosyltransferase [Bacteroidales bacterium]MDD3201790.1 glycosyltransferase [Bacteroidales bacterium]
MTQVKVSVVIPVYDTEKYIEECLLSITNQTLKEIEILVVDGGSKDKGVDIVRGIAANDSRITILKQPGKGLSGARNTGIKAAEGKYLYFIDSDDYLDLDTLELCYEKAEKDNLDFLFFDAQCFKDEGTTSTFWMDYHRAGYVEDKVYTGRELIEQLIAIGRYRASACMNFINRQFFEDAGLSFNTNIMHEDELCTAMLYMEGKRVGRIARDFYQRRVRDSSIMTTSFADENINSYLTIADELTEFGKRKGGKFPDTVKIIIRNFLNPALYNSWNLSCGKRWAVAYKALRKYGCLIKPKNMIVLLFKAPLSKLKGK